jgi:hypothetical protein
MAFCRHGFAVLQFMQPRLKAPIRQRREPNLENVVQTSTDIRVSEGLEVIKEIPGLLEASVGKRLQKIWLRLL